MLDTVFFDHDGPIPFAHRGGAAEGAENSLAAFEKVIDGGYQYLETDVHATSDGKCVIFHDHTLERLTGHKDRVRDLTWNELRSIGVDGESIPLLEDVLVTWPGVRFNIDAKEAPVMAPLVRVLESTKSERRVNIGAFSDARLAAIRRMTQGSVSTICGPRDIVRQYLRAHGFGATVAQHAQCIQVPLGIGPIRFDTRRFIDAAHEVGLPVHYWTIDDPATMNRLLDIGADGIMTDRPTVLRGVLESRGLWSNPS